MNKRERREKYLSTRRTPEFLEKRKQQQEYNKKWQSLLEKYNNLENMTVQEKYDIFVQEGFIDSSVALESILETKK